MRQVGTSSRTPARPSGRKLFLADRPRNISSTFLESRIMHTELSTELRSQVASAVRQGEWPQRALVRLGVEGGEAARWLSMGEQHAQEGAEDDFADLWRAVDVAEADCEKRWVDGMNVAAAAGRKGAGGDGRGSPVRAQDFMMLLERRFPDRWCVKAGWGKQPVKGESLEDALKRIQAEG